MHQAKLAMLCLLVGSSGLFGCGANPDAVQSDGTEKVEGREIAPRSTVADAERWIRIDRAEREQRKLLFTGLGVDQGMTACEVGTGNGFFTLNLARLVYPGGKVFAVDIVPELLEQLARRAAEARRMGDQMVPIERIVGEPGDARLPAGACNLILIAHAYNEFARPRAMLRSIDTAMAGDGRLVLVEYRAETNSGGKEPRRAMAKAQLHRELSDAGFKLVGQIDSLPSQHALFYARKESPRLEVQLRPWRARRVVEPAPVIDVEDE